MMQEIYTERGASWQHIFMRQAIVISKKQNYGDLNLGSPL